MAKAKIIKCPKRGCKSENYSTLAIDTYFDKYVQYAECNVCKTSFKVYLDRVIIPSEIEIIDKTTITERSSRGFNINMEKTFNILKKR